MSNDTTTVVVSQIKVENILSKGMGDDSDGFEKQLWWRINTVKNWRGKTNKRRG